MNSPGGKALELDVDAECALPTREFGLDVDSRRVLPARGMMPLAPVTFGREAFQAGMQADDTRRTVKVMRRFDNALHQHYRQHHAQQQPQKQPPAPSRCVPRTAPTR